MIDEKIEKNKQRIMQEIETTQKLDGYSLKDFIAASRKVVQNFNEKTKELEKKTGMKISSVSKNGEAVICVELNPSEDYGIREGYAWKGAPDYIPDEVYTIIRYNTYAIKKNGDIIMLRDNNGNTPGYGSIKSNEQDIKKIKSYKEDFDEYYKEFEKVHQNKTINLPNTNLNFKLSDNLGYRI